jgi:glycosyltransferase involved in cell wall biosynthesis
VAVDLEPRLSVIMPCFNNGTTIGAALEALARQEYEGWWEVIVADNGSIDDSRAIAETYRSRIARLRVIDAVGANGLPCSARNAAAAIADGDCLLFVDADDDVGERWLAAMADAFRRHDFVASRLDADRLNDPWVRSVRKSAMPGERLPYPPFLPFAGGSGLGVRRELFDELGGFDETLFDTDFMIRAQLAGTALEWADDAVVHVRYKERWVDIFRQGRLYADGNARLMAHYTADRPYWRGWWRWPFRHWRAIMSAAVQPWDRGARARLAWRLGWQVGRIRASVRYRVLAI